MNDILGMLVGMIFGVLAGVPVALLVLFAGRGRVDEEPVEFEPDPDRLPKAFGFEEEDEDDELELPAHWNMLEVPL